MESSALLASNLDRVRERIRSAAVRCGRDPSAISLLAVSKQQSVQSIMAVAAQGQRDFGENYLQEAVEKIPAISVPLTWHYIGQVQSNKTRPIAERFDWVHTIDRLKIAQRLSEQRPPDQPLLSLCIQVKLAEEEGKGGIAPEAVASLALQIAALSRVRLRGLMCIPPPTDRYDEQFAYFKRCAGLLERLNGDLPLKLDTLSMGMSADLEAAIAAGATIVRVGTDIFGARTRREG